MSAQTLGPRDMRQYRKVTPTATAAAWSLLSSPHSNRACSVAQVIGSAKAYVLLALAQHHDMQTRGPGQAAAVSTIADIAFLVAPGHSTIAAHLRWWADTPWVELVDGERAVYRLSDDLVQFGGAAP